MAAQLGGVFILIAALLFASLANWSALSFPSCPICALIQLNSSVPTLFASAFRLVIVCFTSEEVITLLFRAI